MSITEKMRTICGYKGRAVLEYREGRFWAGPYEVPMATSGSTPDEALDILINKLEPVMTLDECWEKLNRHHDGISPLRISLQHRTWDVACNSQMRCGSTLREAYKNLANAFNWKD